MAAPPSPSTADPPASPPPDRATDGNDTGADGEVPLRDPIVALVLAFLIPGAGHLYQGRLVKAGIYAVCIFGLFAWGMSMAEGQCVSFRPPTGENAGNRKEFIHYLGQVGTGAVSLPAILQYRRYFDPGNVPNNRQALTAPFEGQYQPRRQVDGLPEADVDLSGTVSLEPTAAAFGGMNGTLEAVTADGRPLSLTLTDVRIDRPIESGVRRELSASVLSEDDVQAADLDGFVPRPLLDRYMVPLSSEAERKVNARFGTKFDLAAVITMIAGLLNFLAMYDAYAGPAYGYDVAREEPAEAGATA